MLAELYVVSGRDAGKGLSVGVGPVVYLGRATTNQLRVRDPVASRVHCRIHVGTDGLTIHDNDSGNGTFVNDDPVEEPRRLVDLDEIRIGQTRIKVLLERLEDRERWSQRGDSDAGESGDDSDAGAPVQIRLGPRDGKSFVASAGDDEEGAEELTSLPHPALIEPPDEAPAEPEEDDDSEDEEVLRERARRRRRDRGQRDTRGSDRATLVLRTGVDKLRPRPPRAKLKELLPGYEFETRLSAKRGDDGHPAGRAVYRARQRSLDRHVALKVLLARGKERQRLARRLLREAKAIARLPHPHVVTIHDLIQRGSLNVLVMEYCAGGSLADRLEDGPLGWAAARAVARGLAEALAYAHEHGLVHRGVNPSHVLHAPPGAVWKLADFGVTHDPGTGPTGETTFLDTPLDDFGYLAPEQLRQSSEEADPRTDVYGFGATLYACLSGAAPFSARNVATLAAKIVGDDPPPLEREPPDGVDAFLRRCLAKDPAERFADGGELLAALEVLLSEDED